MVCQNGGNISSEYKLPPKNTIGVIIRVGIIDICSKFELINPIKKPNNANVNATSISKKTTKRGYLTSTSTKKLAVMKITTPTINVLVAPAPTKANTEPSVAAVAPRHSERKKRLTSPNFFSSEQGKKKRGLGEWGGGRGAVVGTVVGKRGAGFAH